MFRSCEICGFPQDASKGSETNQQEHELCRELIAWARNHVVSALKAGDLRQLLDFRYLDNLDSPRVVQVLKGALRHDALRLPTSWLPQGSTHPTTPSKAAPASQPPSPFRPTQTRLATPVHVAPGPLASTPPRAARPIPQQLVLGVTCCARCSQPVCEDQAAQCERPSGDWTHLQCPPAGTQSQLSQPSQLRPRLTLTQTLCETCGVPFAAGQVLYFDPDTSGWLHNGPCPQAGVDDDVDFDAAATPSRVPGSQRAPPGALELPVSCAAVAAGDGRGGTGFGSVGAGLAGVLDDKLRRAGDAAPSGLASQFAALSSPSATAAPGAKAWHSPGAKVACRCTSSSGAEPADDCKPGGSLLQVSAADVDRCYVGCLARIDLRGLSELDVAMNAFFQAFEDSDEDSRAALEAFARYAEHFQRVKGPAVISPPHADQNVAECPKCDEPICTSRHLVMQEADGTWVHRQCHSHAAQFQRKWKVAPTFLLDPKFRGATLAAVESSMHGRGFLAAVEPGGRLDSISVGLDAPGRPRGSGLGVAEDVGKQGLMANVNAALKLANGGVGWDGAGRGLQQSLAERRGEVVDMDSEVIVID